MMKKNSKVIVKGYKVFNPDFTCRKMQYSENSEFSEPGELSICNHGLHFCLKAQDCFRYYDFNHENIICEVEARGEVKYHDEDTKACTNILFIGKKLSWHEVLDVANSGVNNTGHSNSGNSNSGNSNSGNRNSGNSNSGNSNSGNSNSGNSNSGNSNSGDRNSGNWNSGNSNSGNWNSGDRNSGNKNSGNWNSGNWNSGDSNSGYRNSGAFCLDNNPVLYLFDKPTTIKVRDWENYEAIQIMRDLLELTIWVPANLMSDKEKKAHPKYKTTEGYLKTIPLKEAWKNMWPNLSDKKKKVFTTLPNFDAAIFEEITGIKV